MTIKKMFQAACLMVVVVVAPMATADQKKEEHPVATIFKAGWQVRATMFRAARDIGCAQAEMSKKIEQGTCDRMAEKRAERERQRQQGR